MQGFVKNCKICGSIKNVCHQYGVRTCRACGEFFTYLMQFIKKNSKLNSRYLKTKSNFKYECKCKEVDKDNNNIQSSTNCKGCRLQKCLSVGMKKLKFRHVRNDVICQQKSEHEDKEGQKIVVTIEDMNIRDQQIINSLLLTFEASIRIIHSFNDLDDIFLNGPILFEDIILSGFNIFNLIECFSPNPLPITYEEVKVWKNKDEGERIFKTRYHKWTIVDRLLSAAIAKSMPIFGKLSLSDQIIHLRYISFASKSFINSYISWQLGVDTWMRKDYVMPFQLIINNKKYQKDKKLIGLYDILFTKSVGHFKQVALSNDEFVLLMAIIFSQPNAEGLSRSGRELLYEESVRYTKILFNYHQRLYGNFEGAKRLDECFSLINKSFENARTFKELRKYQRDSYTNDTLFMICPNFYDLILENKD